MKAVAVSQRVEMLPERDEIRDSLDQRLITLLAEAGIAAFPVPNSLDGLQLRNWLEILRPQGVVLSGGNDIGEIPIRERTERALMRYASYRRLPLLGICRGMQFMATESGVCLDRIEGHVATRHEVEFQDSSSRVVNSFHENVISECPKDYEVLGRCIGDHVIEAVRHKEMCWEGWMWHPEREGSFAPQDLADIENLFGTLAGQSDAR